MIAMFFVQIALYKFNKKCNMFFSKTKLLWGFVIVSTIIIVLMYVINNPLVSTVASALSAIVVSIFVSVLYNEELHKAMDKYQRIGLVDYFGNFEDAHNIIKEKISKAKNVDIFLMYGDSFLSTSTKAIQTLLSKDNSHLRYAIYSLDNKFIEAYANYWGIIGKNPKYNISELKRKIQGVRTDLKRFWENKNLGCIFETFEILNSPISYSFYRMDDELFLVPSKNILSKEIKPAVFLFKKTSSDLSMFNKVIKEFELMINNGEIKKIEL